MLRLLSLTSFPPTGTRFESPLRAGTAGFWSLTSSPASMHNSVCYTALNNMVTEWMPHIPLWGPIFFPPLLVNPSRWKNWRYFVPCVVLGNMGPLECFLKLLSRFWVLLWLSCVATNVIHSQSVECNCPLVGRKPRALLSQAVALAWTDSVDLLFSSFWDCWASSQDCSRIRSLNCTFPRLKLPFWTQG